MKLSATSAALVLAFAVSVSAAPAAYDGDAALSKREMNQANELISTLNTFAKKRDTYSVEELAKRESKIVTDVLTAINSTGLAPKIIEYLVDDPTLGPIAQKAIVALVKSGAVNLDTLLTALNQSGLAVSVAQDLINDCQLYQEIFQVAESYVSNLVQQLESKITGKRELASDVVVPPAYEYKRDEESILVSLMQSLKDSGLASSVVEALVVDKGFLKWGASLIQQLFSSGALTIPELISALAQSGLVPSLFKAFFNLGTLKDVIVTALAAASGKCGGPVSGTVASSANASPTGTTTTPSGKSCRKRRRSYNY